jgi:hypothetical protein
MAQHDELGEPMTSTVTAKRRAAQFRKTRTAGIHVRHSTSCPAAFDKRRCTCTPSWRGRRRNPVTGKPEWSKVTKDRAEILTWLGAGERAKQAIDERAEESLTFGSLGDEWMDGVANGRIQRRRRGKPEPYSPTRSPAIDATSTTSSSPGSASDPRTRSTSANRRTSSTNSRAKA